MLFRAVVISSFAVLVMFRAFAGVETLDTFAPSDLPWFANTKEYRSLYIDVLPELTSEESRRLDSVVREFFSKSNEKNLKCESDILAVFSQKISDAGVALNRRTIRGALRLARKLNLVDDVALTPVLWVLDAVDPIPQSIESEEDQAQFERPIFPYSQVAPISKSEEERKAARAFENSCKLEEKKELEEQNHAFVAECKTFYYSRLSSQCSVSAFKATQELIKIEKGETAAKKIKTRAVLSKIDDLVKTGAISYTRAIYYQRLYEGDVQSKRVSWSDFESRVSTKKDSRIQKDHSNEIPKFLADRMKKSGLSRRVDFYARFDTTQIEELAQLYIDFKDLVSVDNEMTINVSNRDTQEVRWKFQLVDVSQYCVATMIFRELIAEKINSDLFGKTRVSYDDVAAAAIETGYVSANQVNQLLKTDDLWNPKKSGLQKVIDAVVRFGGPAMVFVPPPYNMISSLALTLVQNRKNKTDDGNCKSIGSKQLQRPDPLQPNPADIEVVDHE